jgi:RES domain-containing protein
MRLSPHPESAAIDHALCRCLPLASPWNGDAFRMAEAPYANQTAILSGTGAARWGGRWNPPGILTAYACLDPAFALTEWAAQRRRAGITHRRHLPLTQVTIVVKLHRVLDFRELAVTAAFTLPLDPFLAEPYPSRTDSGSELRAQALGRLAAAHHLEALIVPSAQNPALHNLVIYLPNLVPPSALEIHGKQFLLP